MACGAFWAGRMRPEALWVAPRRRLTSSMLDPQCTRVCLGKNQDMSRSARSRGSLAHVRSQSDSPGESRRVPGRSGDTAEGVVMLSLSCLCWLPFPPSPPSPHPIAVTDRGVEKVHGESGFDLAKFAYLVWISARLRGVRTGLSPICLPHLSARLPARSRTDRRRPGGTRWACGRSARRGSNAWGALCPRSSRRAAGSLLM